MSSTKAIFAAAAICFASSINSHMIMRTPTPYGRATLDSSPLHSNGDDFPCKLRQDTYPSDGVSNVMPIGVNQTLSFFGSAVHGGGSCQISLTTDKEPSKSSKWQVIHSIEGGCPSSADLNLEPEDAKGTNSGTFQYSIPEGIATGDYTLAWTWFNKVGNREMYMNCAPITVTGGSGKRDADAENSGFTKRAPSFPPMFFANIPQKDCGTTEGYDLKFPHPGDSVVNGKPPVSSSLKLPTGTACPGMANGTPTGAGAANTGGVFAGGASPASGSAAAEPSSVVTATPSVASSPTSVSAPVIVASTTTPNASAVATSSPAVVASSSATPAPASSGTTSTAGALTGACTSEGDWNCIGGNSFQRCASGSWSAAQTMAAGTTCQSGQSATLNMSAAAVKHKRAIRFSRGHVKRGLSSDW